MTCIYDRENTYVVCIQEVYILCVCEVVIYACVSVCVCFVPLQFLCCALFVIVRSYCESAVRFCLSYVFKFMLTISLSDSGVSRQCPVQSDSNKYF